MGSYRFTKRAGQDLIDIYLYTLERFGFAQARFRPFIHYRMRPDLSGDMEP